MRNNFPGRFPFLEKFDSTFKYTGSNINKRSFRRTRRHDRTASYVEIMLTGSYFNRSFISLMRRGLVPVSLESRTYIHPPVVHVLAILFSLTYLRAWWNRAAMARIRSSFT